jgi:hypothetical protein
MFYYTILSQTKKKKNQLEMQENQSSLSNTTTPQALETLLIP